MRGHLGWVVLLAAAAGLTACEDEREAAHISSVVVIAATTGGTTIVPHGIHLADARIATASYLAARDAALQHDADSTASSDYPELAPDQLDMASEPIGGDGQA